MSGVNHSKIDNSYEVYEMNPYEKIKWKIISNQNRIKDLKSQVRSHYTVQLIKEHDTRLLNAERELEIFERENPEYLI